MSDKAQRARSVPQWPKTSAVLHDDGTGELTINGVSEPIAGADINVARGIVLERVAAYARDELARPVRLQTTDPDGQWELAVHPNGDVDEIAGEPTAVAATAPPPRTTRRRPAPFTAAPRAARTSARTSRRRLLEAAAALLVLTAAITTVVVLTSANDAAAPRRTVSTPAPTRAVAPGTIADIVDAARAKAAAHDAAIAKARHQRFVRRQAAARRRAVQRRVARKHATARRARARAAARARARRQAAASRPPAAVTPRPTTPRPVAPPPPPPPVSPVCQEFPPC